MNISVPCPNSLLTFSQDNPPTELAAISVANGLLTIAFDYENATVDTCVAAIRDMEAFVGGLIADNAGDENGGPVEPATIRMLGELKATIAGFEPLVRSEHVYKTRASADDATIDLTGSQLRVKQDASSEDASEQHGAATAKQGVQNEQAQQEDPVERPADEQPRSRRDRR